MAFEYNSEHISIEAVQKGSHSVPSRNFGIEIRISCLLIKAGDIASRGKDERIGVQMTILKMFALYDFLFGQPLDELHLGGFSRILG